MKKILVVLCLILFASVVSAEVLCIKKKVSLVNGKINLGKAVRKVAGDVCPARTKFITNLSGLANEAGDVPSVAPGKLLTGTFATGGTASNVSDFSSSNITFPASIGGTTPAHVIEFAASPTTECPGTATNPDAAPGHFCVYVNDVSGILSHQVWDPLTSNNGTVSPLGASIYAYASGSGTFYSWGTWAIRTIVIE